MLQFLELTKGALARRGGSRLFVWQYGWMDAGHPTKNGNASVCTVQSGSPRRTKCTAPRSPTKKAK